MTRLTAFAVPALLGALLAGCKAGRTSPSTSTSAPGPAPSDGARERLEPSGAPQGDHFEVYWDGNKAIDGHDRTFPDAGKVCVWTKADSVTYFDDLVARPL